MSALLAHAVRAIADLRGTAHARAIDRVELRKDGTLFLQGTDEKHEMCWYQYQCGGLTQLNPLQDQKLPLVRSLAHKGIGDIRVLTWRPERRIVLREITARGEGPILKGYRKGRSRAAGVRHRAAVRATSSSGLIVAPLRAQDPDRELLIFEPLSGSHLDLSEIGVDEAFRIGALLGRLHASEHSETLDLHSAKDELAVIARWFDIRERATSPPLPEEVALLTELRGIAAQLPSVESRLCHRDLHDGQFLVGRDGIALLDFDLLCLADPALDAANLSAHYCLRAVQGIHGATVSSSRMLGDALLEGLEPPDENFWRRMRFYQAASFLRLSQLYLMRPKWSRIATDLFQLALRCTHEIHAA